VFTQEERDGVRVRLLELAGADPRIVAAAETGSTAGESHDAWSDVDLAFALAADADVQETLQAWTAFLESGFGAVHHWDLAFRGSIYRVFLLAGGLEVDLAFVPEAEFGPRGPAFRIVFGEGEKREPALVDPDHLAGLGWHHLLHARAAIERGQPWKAEFYVSAARDHVLALACLRHGESADYARGIDRLPGSVTEPFEDSLPVSLDREELRRALAVVAAGYLRELDAELALRVAPIIEALL
jgi:hypothetical protein